MNWIWNVLLSLVSGSVGSVLFAQTAGRRAEMAKTRYTTTTALRGVLRTYRQELDYQYARVRSEQHGFPPEFAALPGQEKMAEDVLRALPDLTRRTRRKLREDLVTLAGTTTVDFAENRMYVPAPTRNEQGEQARLELALHRVNVEPDRYAEGILARLLSDQNRPEHQQHYEAAQVILDRMATLAKP